jgi:hypothetical protein
MSYEMLTQEAMEEKTEENNEKIRMILSLPLKKPTS